MKPLPRRRAAGRPVLLAGLAIAAGCAGAPPFNARAVAAEWAAFMQRDYVLRAGDRIAVSFYPEQSFEYLAQEVVVSPSGTVALERIPDELRAAGLSVAAFRRDVQAAYAKVLKNFEASVSLVGVSAQSVYVAGEVNRGGVVAYVPGMTLSQAIAASGGLRITAKWSDVRILRNRGGPADRTYRVDIESILEEGTPDFLLLPGDVVYAQTSGIADVGNWVDLWIRRILPFQVTGVAIDPNRQ